LCRRSEKVTQRRIYATRADAKTEILNFVEMFYKPIKRHSCNGGVSPVKFEEAVFQRLEGV
jgi:putative transposase